MKRQSMVLGALAVLVAIFLAAPVVAQQKAKAKAQKVSGDIGLLDTEKHYMIVVTKDGKLITVGYTDKTKVTAMVPGKGKMADIGLGSSAAVQYTKKGASNYLNSIEYVAKKGGE